MTGERGPHDDEQMPVGSFAEAARFRLRLTLTLSFADRLRELEAMWDFNNTVETHNPRVRDIAARLRARRTGQAGP